MQHIRRRQGAGLRALVAAENHVAPGARHGIAGPAAVARRRSSMGHCGMSMPVRKRLGACGMEWTRDRTPTQMPQLAQRSASTTAMRMPRRPFGVRHHGDRGIGAIVKAAAAATAVVRVHHGHRLALRCRQKGQQPPDGKKASEQRRRGGVGGGVGQRMEKKHEPVQCEAVGTVAEVGRALAVNRQHEGQRQQRRGSAQGQGRGGNTLARLMRWMWNHRPKISSSGTPDVDEDEQGEQPVVQADGTRGNCAPAASRERAGHRSIRPWPRRNTGPTGPS